MQGGTYYRFIREAYRALNRGRYSEALLLLEKTAPDISDPYPWFLLAVASAYEGRFREAEKAAEQVHRFDPGYRPLVQLQAFLQFKSAGTREYILSYYLDLIKQYPGNVRLEDMRRDLGERSDFAQFQREARLARYVDIPAPDRHLRRRLEKMNLRRRPALKRSSPGSRRTSAPLLLIILLLVPVLVGSTLFIYRGEVLRKVDSLFSGSAEGTAELNHVRLMGQDYDLIEKISRDKRKHYYYSADQLTEDFNRARKLIKQKKYNRALLILNRIDGSNVSQMVREKTQFFRDFVARVDDRSFEDIPFGKIEKDPWLYRGAALSLTGRVANLREGEESRSFNLLVGYEKQDRFESVAEVYQDDPAREVSNGDQVRVRGIFVYFIGSGKRAYIEVRSLEPVQRR